jgi:hypothetical protein
VIVVIGSPIGRLESGTAHAAGMASIIALTAAASGRVVQLIGRIGDDPTADAVVLDLAAGGVGHVALLRDVAHLTPLEPPIDPPADLDDESDADPPQAVGGLPLEPADVDLGLRYLTAFEVLVLTAGHDAELDAVAVDAARWAGASLILVLAPDASPAGDLPPDAIAFEAPSADPDGAFASLVGRFAAALDDGVPPGDAFRATVESDGWAPAADD